MDDQLTRDSHQYIRYASIVMAAAIVLTVGWSVAGGGGVDETELEAAIHDEINEERQAADVSKVNHDETMAANAKQYSQRMSEDDWFSHDPPDGTKETIGCAYRGENLLKEPDTVGDPDRIADRIVSSWMASEDHKQNILDGGYSRQGIGVSVDNQIIVTQRLCG